MHSRRSGFPGVQSKLLLLPGPVDSLLHFSWCSCLFFKILFLTVLGLVAARGLCAVVVCGLLSGRGAQASGVSRALGLQGLQQVGSVVHTARWLKLMGSRARAQHWQYTGLVALRVVESSQTSGWTCIPYTGRQVLIHCMTREVQRSCLTLLHRTKPLGTSSLAWSLN